MGEVGTVATRRLLLVHAHPDDESIGTGATMAGYAASGAQVTLLTCTLGEQGEILVPEYAQLAAEQGDQLGGLRIGELAGALTALGVTDHRFLGGAGHFRDSGMLGTSANDHPRAFWRAATDPAVFGAALTAAVGVIRDVRPQVVVTYDDNGDYGHPDHVMAHRVTTAAVRAAADPAYGTGRPWTVAKFYWTATPRTELARGAAALRAVPDPPFEAVDEPSSGVTDDVVTTVVDGGAQLGAKVAALRAHRTQVLVTEPFFALSNRIGRRLIGTEWYRLVAGEPGGARDAEGRETDLFGGLG